MTTARGRKACWFKGANTVYAENKYNFLFAKVEIIQGMRTQLAVQTVFLKLYCKMQFRLRAFDGWEFNVTK